jgi:hypothetical protein
MKPSEHKKKHQHKPEKVRAGTHRYLKKQVTKLERQATKSDLKTYTG